MHSTSKVDTFLPPAATSRATPTTSEHKGPETQEDARTRLATELLLLRNGVLAPVIMYPQKLSRATEIRYVLARIECVAIHAVVEREEGVRYFVLDVYRSRQQKGLPSTTRWKRVAGEQRPMIVTHEPGDRAPDYQIEQRYSSFARLRANVARVARKHHPKCQSCSYCARVQHFLRTTSSKPCLKVKFTTTTDERTHILSTFINALLAVVREDYTLCTRSLRGYHMIPALVKRFLSEQTGEYFFA
ncbi:hypothetical protein PsorP6_001823 [Peronosclerospora sorghi]|uniref:Uncharacterized protein n=1 Tax=Peronosclerospora sorghi TaxID=230839 RepID=A0ACC0WQS7_9STRA|nr:hypothetical protein PsorP6_001823 [Peronosclerospora sorghi]